LKLTNQPQRNWLS